MERDIDVHLVVSYNPTSRLFQMERPLASIVFRDGQVFDNATRKYQPNYEDGNLTAIVDASDQLESALRVINTVPDRA